MKILQEANTWVIDSYGKIFAEMDYGPSPRLHRYILTIPQENGNMLLYNGITKELVEFEPGDDLFDKKFFDTMWFVRDDYEESSIVSTIKSRLERGRPKGWAPQGYTILTTTDCNARCFYCYEKGILKKNMTPEVAADVGDYIVKNCNVDGMKKPLNISWFGGEPLFNKEAIDIIIGKLVEAGIPYTSSMISNGYLFDLETVKHAKAKWHLRNVQITLDGTSANYKKAKNYIYGDEDPFETVMKNIDCLSSYKIRVSIRANVGYYNCEDISNLADIVADRFSQKNNVSMYIHSLFDNGAVTDITDPEKEKKVFEEMAKIEEKLVRLGIGKRNLVGNDIRGTHCMADNGRHAVIQCNGDITLCEHYVDSEKYTSIYSDERDESVREKFKEVAQPYDRCYSCPLIMDCSALKMCEDNDGDCSEVRQRYKIEKKINAIKRLAESIHAQENKPKENEDLEHGN